jgi:alkanesulfonate monooxygenase SsuD/methylene tetrahydromethanopterin reductase-like flavin-dependent oxidoreductase (luciferase family)
MRRGIVFATDALEPLAGLARDAEAAGLDRVWTTEYVHRDAVARALFIALGTERIEVGTGVAYAFARAPLGMAGLAADVQRLSDGRFALGISPGTRGVRRWFDAEFEPPAPRIAAYADALRTAWARDPRLDVGPPPVFASALNPIMARWVGRSCDGALLHPLALGRVHLEQRLLPALRRGLDERGSDGPFEVAAWCITSIDDDADAARERGRAQLAFYLSTPSYRTVAEGTAWAGVPAAVREAFDASGRTAPWSEIGALVPDAVVDELVLWGTPEHVRARAAVLERELAGLGVTELVFQTVGSDLPDADVIANCRRIAAVLGASPRHRL